VTHWSPGLSPSTEGWNRREFIGAAALVALAAGIPAAAVRLTDLDAEDLPDEAQRRLIAQVCQIVLPRTGTQGAGDVGVGDFVILALAHGLDATKAAMASAQVPNFAGHARRDGSLRYLDWLEAELDAKAGGYWLGRPLQAQKDALSSLDAASYPPPGQDGFFPWQKIKGLILTGYYTSEEGASHELRFELTPGRFDSDLPLKPGTIALSSDWNAVDFG
jgi:hypothetical protein